MAIIIKYAHTPQEKDALYRLRHQVFVEEEGYMAPTADGKIQDRFDDYATTVNIIAVDNGQVIGGVRFTQANPLGMPPDEFFNSKSLALGASAQLGSGGQFCLLRTYRGSRLAIYLLGMAHHWSRSQGLSHILCAVNPEIQHLLGKIGYRTVGAEQYDAEKALAFVPMCLDLRDLCSSQHRFVKQQRGEVFHVPMPRHETRHHFRKAA